MCSYMSNTSGSGSPLIYIYITILPVDSTDAYLTCEAASWNNKGPDGGKANNTERDSIYCQQIEAKKDLLLQSDTDIFHFSFFSLKMKMEHLNCWQRKNFFKSKARKKNFTNSTLCQVTLQIHQSCLTTYQCNAIIP